VSSHKHIPLSYPTVSETSFVYTVTPTILSVTANAAGLHLFTLLAGIIIRWSQTNASCHTSCKVFDVFNCLETEYSCFIQLHLTEL